MRRRLIDLDWRHAATPAVKAIRETVARARVVETNVSSRPGLTVVRWEEGLDELIEGSVVSDNDANTGDRGLCVTFTSPPRNWNADWQAFRENPPGWREAADSSSPCIVCWNGRSTASSEMDAGPLPC